MKKFVLLHYGFEKPTPEIMAAWGKWFKATKPHAVDMGGFGYGGEISRAERGIFCSATDFITGFTIVNAAKLDDAEKIAQGNLSFRASGLNEEGRADAQELVERVVQLVVVRVASVRK